MAGLKEFPTIILPILSIANQQVALFVLRKTTETQAEPNAKFGSLTAIKFLRRERSRNIWEFKCDQKTHTANMYQ